MRLFFSNKNPSEKENNPKSKQCQMHINHFHHRKSKIRNVIKCKNGQKTVAEMIQRGQRRSMSIRDGCVNGITNGSAFHAVYPGARNIFNQLLINANPFPLWVQSMLFSSEPRISGENVYIYTNINIMRSRRVAMAVLRDCFNSTGFLDKSLRIYSKTDWMSWVCCTFCTDFDLSTSALWKLHMQLILSPFAIQNKAECPLISGAKKQIIFLFWKKILSDLAISYSVKVATKNGKRKCGH